VYPVYFYKDKHGRQPVLEYMRSLSQKGDKDSRLKLNKIQEYIQVLSQFGTRAGTPYVKHIEGYIWELRPQKCRIFFVGWINGSYILLHHFDKKTKKTPRNEIDKAKREYNDLIQKGDQL